MKNVSDLRAALGDALAQVMSGEITVDQARAVATIGSVICDSAKIEIDMARATDGDYKGSGFIDVDPNPRKRIGN